MMTKVMVVMFMWTYVTEGDDDGEDEGEDCDEVDDNNDDDGDGSSVGHGDPSTQYDNYVCIGRFYARGCAYINATKSIHARVWCVCVCLCDCEFYCASSLTQTHIHILCLHTTTLLSLRVNTLKRSLATHEHNYCLLRLLNCLLQNNRP